MSTATQHTHYCPHCGKPMYFDGRCGDPSICLNPPCREWENREAEYWAGTDR